MNPLVPGLLDVILTVLFVGGPIALVTWLVIRYRKSGRPVPAKAAKQQ